VSFLSRGLEETFLHSAIPCELIGGLEFFDRAEVKDMISYLRLFSNSQDRVAFERVLNVPKRQLGSKTQILIEENYEKSWIQALHRTIPQLTPIQQGSASEFIRIYKELSPEADAKPYKTLMQLVEELQYENYLEKAYKKDSDGRLENVSELANLLKEAEDIGKSFSEFYDENLVAKSQQDDIDDMNKVKVLTCHSAKGLEWPIVFITAMEQNIFPHSKSLFKADKTEEERRLFYVAVTRAKENLYITSSKKREFWGNKVQSEISQFLELLKEEDAIEIEDLVDTENMAMMEEATVMFA
jgi:DNA helicase-2/ATP-dependent DNA helicase PcrA